MKIRKMILKVTAFLLLRRLAGSYKFSHIIFEGSDASETLSVSPNNLSGSAGGIGFPK